MPGRRLSIEDVEAQTAPEAPGSKSGRRRMSIEDVERQQINQQPHENFPSVAEMALRGVGEASRFVDKYTTAPIRAGVYSYQKGASLGDALGAAGHQFGENPDDAPRNADIAEELGLPTSYKFGNPVSSIVGPKELEVNPAEIAGFGMDVVTDPLNYVGGPLKGALEKAGKYTAPAVEKGSEIVANYLKNKAAERAVKATTGQNISALRKMTGSTHNSAGDIDKIEKGLRKTGRAILDEDVLGSLDRVEDLAPKLSEARKRYGGMIQDVGKEIDKAAPGAVSAKGIADDLLSYATSIPETEAGKRLQGKILDEASNFEKMGSMSFEDAQKFKNQFKYKPQDADALISSQDATNKIRSIIGNQMDTTAESLSKSAPDNVKDLLGRYKEIKSKYGSFKGASDAASDRVQKNLSNRFVSPSDYGVGAASGITMGLAGNSSDDESKLKYLIFGALGAAANKFARQRGSSLAAKTANNLAKTVERAPGFAGKFGNLMLEAAKKGPAALVTTHHLMMRRPEYKSYFEGEQDQ